MGYVLVSHTRGDELIAPATRVVAEGNSKSALETLLTERQQERDAWLRDNPLPTWAQCSVIAFEEILEA